MCEKIWFLKSRNSLFVLAYMSWWLKSQLTIFSFDFVIKEFSRKSPVIKLLWPHFFGYAICFRIALILFICFASVQLCKNGTALPCPASTYVKCNATVSINYSAGNKFCPRLWRNNCSAMAPIWETTSEALISDKNQSSKIFPHFWAEIANCYTMLNNLFTTRLFFVVLLHITLKFWLWKLNNKMFTIP